jgi:HPt (histidine-containing phosphotransfer) domain-containing protein
MFYQVYEEELPTIQAALAAGDTATVARRAHRLKGSVSNLCGRAMQQVVETMEQQAAAGDLAALPPLLDRLMHEFQQLKSVLDDIPNVEAKETAS